MDGLEIKKVAIDDADVSQLRAFNNAFLQIETTGKENGNQLRNMIKSVWDKDEIFLPQRADKYGDTPDSQGRPGQPFKHEFPKGSGRERDCVRVVIPKMDPKIFPGGTEPVPVSLNGSAMYIPRGAPQIIPVEYAEILASAERFVYPEYDPEEDNGRGGLKEPQVVKEYPFNYA